MNVIETALPEVKIIEPVVHGDQRGFFMETWQEKRYIEYGINLDNNFVQDNLSSSRKNVLRGLHYQHNKMQAKLVYVLQGAVFDVAVDIRKGSPNFGKWVGVELSSENKLQLYVPAGFAHGFCVTSDTVMFAYKCSDIYDAASEVSILWNDPEIGIEWPINSPLLSDKDLTAKPLNSIPSNLLPNY